MQLQGHDVLLRQVASLTGSMPGDVPIDESVRNGMRVNNQEYTKELLILTTNHLSSLT